MWWLFCRPVCRAEPRGQAPVHVYNSTLWGSAVSTAQSPNSVSFAIFAMIAIDWQWRNIAQQHSRHNRPRCISVGARQHQYSTSAVVTSSISSSCDSWLGAASHDGYVQPRRAAPRPPQQFVALDVVVRYTPRCIPIFCSRRITPRLHWRTCWRRFAPCGASLGET